MTDLSKFSDAPNETPMSADTQELLACIDALLDHPSAKFAWNTLEGIKKTITNARQATSGQAQAVENIARAVKRNEDEEERRPARGGSRRYEGFSR